MAFIKYQHIERLGTTETEGIEMGVCYVFPKIDGTNGSLWWEDGLCAGSRRRQLSAESDNAGFFGWAQAQEFDKFFKAYPDLRLFGEFLVPHSLRTYVDSAWRNFYVFDVMDGGGNYMPYEEYAEILAPFAIEYIPPITKIKNPTHDTLINFLPQNTYLIKDGCGAGEGIVIKNYEFVNKYGRVTWAKCITNEFKAKHVKEMGVGEKKQKTGPEELIVNDYITPELVEKEYAKIALEGWSSKQIPRLLNTVYYCLIKEESWNFVKKLKNPIIDFKRLQALTFAKVKETKPELF